MLAVADAIDAKDWGALPKPEIRLHGQPENEDRSVLLWDGEWEVTYVTFRDMGVVFGDKPPMRYPGLHKSPGPQYFRGVSEWSSDGSWKDDAMWIAYSVNKEDIWVSRVQASSHTNGTAYATLTAHRFAHYRPYVYKTADFGKTWTKIVNGIPAKDYTHVVREDPVRRGMLYAGTQHGVYISMDDGDHWRSLSLNLPDTPVHDLVVEGNDIVTGILIKVDASKLQGKGQDVASFIAEGGLMGVSSYCAHFCCVPGYKESKIPREAGLFDKELYHELMAMSLHLSPLRDRSGDVAPIVESLLRRKAAESARGAHVTLTAEALQALEAYPWPGNLDELEPRAGVDLPEGLHA